MPRRRHKLHNECDSPFFRLQRKSKLARLLYISQRKLLVLTQDRDLYYQFRIPKVSGGYRDICAPRDDLKAIQARIADLLHRIAPPDYLFAPVSGRSYVDNAAIHNGAHSIYLLDIIDFFPSCTDNKVVWFFRKRMQCSPDVAAILARIVSRDGSLPQGSPCSPILAYLCYIDMWEEISYIVKSSGCSLSVYADDLTISGKTIPREIVWNIKRTLRKHGHRHNLSKERSKHRRSAEVTGVIVNFDSLNVPNRQHQKLYHVRKELAKTKSETRRATLGAQVRGREAQMQQILSQTPAI